LAKSSLLPRGFKSNSEKISLDFRRKLNLQPHDPLCGFELASYLKIAVFSATEFFPEGTNISSLVGTKTKDKGWSALTMKTSKNNTIIIHNHLHAPTRQQSNLMHELAHVICKHEYSVDNIEISIPNLMRKFDKQQEEEANYLGSALQIPREALLWALKEKMQKQEIAEYFNASPQMVTLRINSTGVKSQLNYLDR
jgi:Zn-dependent peptidase ImmA (M78 family)